MPDIDSKLATGLRQAKSIPMFFVFVAKGANDGALLVSREKISTKEINEANAESGGKLVFRGRCQAEDGRMVFEIAKEPPTTLAKQLKVVIQREAGLMLKVETRRAADLEDEVDSEQVDQAPEERDETHFADRLRALAPVLHKALVAGIPQAQEVKQKVTEASLHFRKLEFDHAGASLDQAEALLKQIRGNAEVKEQPSVKPLFTQLESKRTQMEEMIAQKRLTSPETRRRSTT